MADALVLGASTSVCGFKSHLPHYGRAVADVTPPKKTRFAPFWRANLVFWFGYAGSGVFRCGVIGKDSV